MGSDYSDSDSSAGSSAGYGKKHKKEKKEKKDKDKKGNKEEKDKHKDKDEKKDKAKKDKHKHKHKQKGDEYSYGLGSSSSNNAYHNNLTFPSAAHGSYDILGSHNPVSTYGKAPAISPSSFPSLGFTGLPQSQPQPPAAPASAPAMSFGSPPPSGYRIPLDSGDGQPFPSNIQETGPPAAHDLDGSPIFLGSVLFHNAVHPCKIGPHLHPPAQVAYGGGEVGHNGRYDLLPFVPEEMEWVVTGNGRIPEGRRPVEGGYEEDGSKLYHALAEIEGVRVPGKTGEHLGGCNVGFGGREHSVQSGYEILCWRY